MNKIIPILAIVPFLTLSVSTGVLAQTVRPSVTTVPSPSASLSGTIKPTASAEDKQIENIKNTISNKVLELRKKGLKATAGVITSIGNDKIGIKNALDTTSTIKVDETLTHVYQISGNTKKEIKQSDLKKDMYIIVSGPVLEDVITANVIYVDDQYVVKSGKIVEVNSTDSSIKVITSERDTVTLDITGRQTLQMMDSKTFELSATTFAKIKEGDSVHFVYVKTGKEQQANRYDALKFVVIPQEYFLQK